MGWPVITGTARGLNMLILTRRAGETLVIGDGIEITVLGTKGNQVRLGVKATRDVPVHRAEIYERIQQERAVLIEPEHG